VSDLLTAFGLLLVLEGIVPLAFPQAYKRYIASVLKMPDSTLQKVGLACLVAGVALVYWIRS
jgi:uncharacterized protein YjeT (DUF2065 family)